MSRVYLLFLACLCLVGHASTEEHIYVHKNGVPYTFAKYDIPTDYFAEHLFPNWEKDTFQVFEHVKNPANIAIDLGAWIGTTAIWLANNFYHVITVEPDVKSLVCLRRNLHASNCSNVSICEFPISDRTSEVIFGPRNSLLNESISCIKTLPSNPNDYIINTINFHQLINDYYHSNTDINSRKVSFIKCDIEGGEEDILVDLLQFTLDYDCSAYISFHYTWWKEQSIRDFEGLFSEFNVKYFDINTMEFHQISDLSQYISDNPFSSFLFEPLTGD